MSATPVARAELAPLSRPRLYWAVADALVLCKRHLLHTIRVPELLVFSTIQPVMFVLLFRYVFGGAIAVQGTSYVNFLMAGIFVQTVAFGSVATGIGLAEDMRAGLVDRFRTLPMAGSAVLTGRTLADLVRNTFVVLVMLGVGLAVGFRPQGSALGWVAAFAMLLLVSFAFSWIGAAIALLVRNVEAVQSAGFIWLFPLTFASSAFVPTDTMPGWLQAFADNQPFTLVVNSVRGFVLGEPDSAATWQAVVWCVGIVAVFVPLSTWAYRRVKAT
jgi:ABC-2 type transport system permease protein/oleandomycin transport system permease protein